MDSAKNRKYMVLKTKTPFLETKDLTVGFGGQVVLDGVSLAADAGGIVCLLGHSGSGKTTFLRTLNRLNDEMGAVTKGSVNLFMDGRWCDILAPGTDLLNLRRKVGMVFQMPNLMPVSIAKNILVPLRLTSGLGKKQCRARMYKVLEQTQLWSEVGHRLDEPALSLSGGQQQRLCLARCLALEPQILLLDEPTASLDFRAGRRIEELLIYLAQSYPMLVVSHSPAQAERLAQAAFVFESGKVVHKLNKASIHRYLIEQCITGSAK
jgi:phosphate transport system ATP-binding protein